MNIKPDKSKKSEIDSIKGIIYKYHSRYQSNDDENPVEAISEGALYKKLSAIRFRYRLFICEEAFLKILTAGFIFLLVETIYRHFLNLSANIQIILITIPIIFAIYTIIAALRNRKSWDELVKIIDSQLGLKERLVTGLEFSGHYKKSKLYNTLIADTINLLNSGNVKKNLNQRISKTTKALLLTLILLGISALLLPRLPFYQDSLNPDRVASSETSLITPTPPSESKVPEVIEEEKDHKSKQISEKDNDTEQLSKEDALDDNKNKATETNLSERESLEKDVDQIMERILSLLNKLTGSKDKDREKGQTPSDSLLAQAGQQQEKKGDEDRTSPNPKDSIPSSGSSSNSDSKIDNNQGQQSQDNIQGQNQPDRSGAIKDGNKANELDQAGGSDKNIPNRSNAINNMQEKGSGGAGGKETGSSPGPAMGGQQISGNGQAQDSNPITGDQAPKGLNSGDAANKQSEAMKSKDKQTAEQKERIDNNAEMGDNSSSDKNLVKNDIEKTSQKEPSAGGEGSGINTENKIKEDEGRNKDNIQQEQTADRSGSDKEGATGLDTKKVSNSGQEQGKAKEEEQLAGKASMPHSDIHGADSQSETQEPGDKGDKTGDERRSDLNGLDRDKGDESPMTKEGKEEGRGDKTEAAEGGMGNEKPGDKQSEDLKGKEEALANNLNVTPEVKNTGARDIAKEKEQLAGNETPMPQQNIQGANSTSEAQKAGDKRDTRGDEGQVTKEGKEEGRGDKTEAAEGGMGNEKPEDKQSEDLKGKEGVSGNDLQTASKVKDEKAQGIEKEGQKGGAESGAGEKEAAKGHGQGEIAGDSGAPHPEDATSIKKDIDDLLSNIEKEIKTIEEGQKKQQQGGASGTKEPGPGQSSSQSGGINSRSDTTEGGRENKLPAGSDQQSGTDNKQSFTGGSQDGTDAGSSKGSESADTGSMASPGKSLPSDGPFAGNKSADKLYSSEEEDLSSIKGKETELFIDGEQDEAASQQREARTYGTQLAPDELIEPTAPIDSNAMLNPEQSEEGAIKNNQIPIEYEKIIKKLYIDKD